MKIKCRVVFQVSKKAFKVYMKKIFRSKAETPESSTGDVLLPLPKEPPRIFSTINNNDIETIKSLLADKNLDPNTTEGYDEDTALIWAAYLGKEDIVRLLCADKRVDVNKRNFEGNTPLFYAAARNKGACVGELLQHEKIDIHAQGSGERTALQIALENGASDAVAVLMEDERVTIDSNIFKIPMGKEMLKVVLGCERLSAKEAILAFEQQKEKKIFAVELCCQKGLSPGEFIEDEELLAGVMKAVAKRNRSHQKSANK